VCFASVGLIPARSNPVHHKPSCRTPGFDVRDKRKKKDDREALKRDSMIGNASKGVEVKRPEKAKKQRDAENEEPTSWAADRTRIPVAIPIVCQKKLPEKHKVKSFTD
jgi:hypothetical protein